MVTAQTDQAIGIAVLKKSIDAESSGVMELLSTVTPPASNSAPAVNLPANLGQHINTTA
jgi:hypothetical protein